MDKRHLYIQLFADFPVPVFYKQGVEAKIKSVLDYWSTLGFSVSVKKDKLEGVNEFIYLFRSRYIRRNDSAEITEKEYVVVPSFQNPRWIIENTKEAVQNHGPIIKPTSRSAVAVWYVAKILNRLNFFNVIFPDRIRTRGLSLGSPFEGVGLSKANILYTGAPGKFQKFTLQYVGEASLPVGFLKISSSKHGIERLRNEGKALGYFSSYNPASFKVPKFLGEVERNGFYGFFQSNILRDEGVTAEFSIADQHAIYELYQFSGIKRASLSEYKKEMNLDLLTGSDELLSDLNCIFSDGNIKLGLSHGDYIPWNRFVSGGGVKIIDWETCRYRPIFYDVVYFLIHKGLLVDRIEMMPLLVDIETCLTELSKNNWRGVEVHNVRGYMILSLVEMLVHYKLNDEVADSGFIRNIESGILNLVNKNNVTN